MRKAARQLGWKGTTIGWIGPRYGTMVAVQNTHDVPDEDKAAVDAAMDDRLRAVLHRVWGEPGPAPVQRGSVILITQEFRAAVAKTNA
ncbi:hypothetical protein [Streptomyces sp. ok210]|jgi:hypothetical protein|uniref:hypothetical protein n=1 Tax=Streptomyces sp. ok210 TaxID=1761905 RepID=UPI0008E93DC6|nr:hypothetical protein [Streptomyces sp. ok210]SFT22369.1 hypothetical protein SAMN04487982_110201 [Streptomyces sp. ok210]